MTTPARLTRDTGCRYRPQSPGAQVPEPVSLGVLHRSLRLSDMVGRQAQHPRSEALLNDYERRAGDAAFDYAQLNAL